MQYRMNLTPVGSQTGTLLTELYPHLAVEQLQADYIGLTIKLVFH